MHVYSRPNERDNNVVTMTTDAQRSQAAAIITDSPTTLEAYIADSPENYC